MKHQILVVEDEGLVARDIQATLVALGYSVPATASSGEDALKRADELHPDLVLMDIHLPGKMDGITAAEQLRLRLDVPVVFLTAYADDDHLERAKRTQPFGYLLKPFYERELRSTVEIAIHKCQAERETRQQRRWLDATLRSIGDAVIVVDADQRIRFINPIAVALTGWSRQEALGMHVHEVFRIVHEHTGEAVDSPIRSALALGSITSLASHSALMARDGSRIPIDDSVGPIPGEHDCFDGAVIVFRDGRPQRKFHQQLAHADRLSALGTLAGGVAHEINNPLAYALANVEFVLKALSEAGSARRDELKVALADAVDGLLRIKGLVSDLSSFVRGDSGPIVAADVSAALTVALKIASVQLKDRATITQHLDPLLPRVLGSESRLAQVFLNLLVNAGQSIPVGDVEKNFIRVSTRVEGNGRVAISILDTGTGMPPDVVRHVFEPFFTTKTVGSGTGLGLSISHGIVARLGGEISVESEVGRGTEFTVFLPIAPESASDPSESEMRTIAKSPSAAYDAACMPNPVATIAQQDGASPTDSSSREADALLN